MSKLIDKRAKMTEVKGKPPLKNLREAQESVRINKTLAKVRLDSDNENVGVYSMICDVKQILLKDSSLGVGRYKVFLTNQNLYAVIK